VLGQLVTVSFSLLMAAQPPSMPSGAPDARLAGRVVDAETSAPVAGAIVRLVPVAQPFPAAAMAPPQALTGANGEFTVQRVWAGRYRLEIQKTGFAPLSDLTGAPLLEINRGQSVTGLVFALKKGSIIAGRIVEAGGEPLRELMVAALPVLPDGREPSSGASRTARMAESNDSGEFRLADLAEGRYLIIAAPPPRPRPPLSPSQPELTTVVAPTYYPGTPDREAAHIIDLQAGQTIEGIQFSMMALPAHRISGIVVDETGTPQAGVMLALMDGPGFTRTTPPMTQTDHVGAFIFGGLVAGKYRVTAMMAAPIAFRGGAGRNAGLPGGAGGAAVAVPVGGVQTQGLPSAEVTVDVTEVTGVRIVVPARR
jgi:Carboxypeptidase regulatory-like domain